MAIRTRMRNGQPRLLALALALVAAAGCDDSPIRAAANTAPPAPVAVTVVTLERREIPVTSVLPGRTAPFRAAEVRPQVGGVLRERLFTEGEAVMAGQPLFQIDPAPFEASVRRAEAALTRIEAAERVALSTAARLRALARVQAVSEQNLENAEATLRQVQADIISTRAALETARIDLGYTRVASPIAGRTGRATVTPGALVTANQATALVTVTQLDPILVDLTQPSAVLLQQRRDVESGALRRPLADRAVARLVLEDGSEYPHAGEVQFSEVIVDQGTGSVTLRAVFPNPDQLLLPGMFVRARVEEGVTDRAILVPQRAVLRTPRGEPMTFVVNAEGVVEQRVLRASRTVGNDWLVTEGVAAGERVVIEGVQRIRAGARVQARERPTAAAS
ncbi:efflux RND transporter periplasmic adaptor subunit [Roseomonas sp. PWR1]|uniref:Efflux RND transporter periplasmic adaptor subunit n=1 Tax=Roseomonas nitratireducens TaxID=2820810 RepID=A0ABS4AQ43_9PROT|nr:efflux RND transporter periplasmic adaptor subunit [Neoroseomonas nitratireducens]MBP0463478.1 efflux RND transporter periplasmic adaptor subunit [Neoroseomonas nitratireducens]